MSAKTRKPSSPPTIITLTLPEKDGGEGSGTLLIQRGELAHVRQFTYGGVNDIADTIKAAYIALSAVEAEPPVIPEAPKTAPNPEPKTKSNAKAAQVSAAEEEPTIDIPLKKGTKAVRISHLKIVGGETDAAAYKQAVLLAGKLIDGKLWDGATPICFDDVYAVAKKMQYLTEKDLSLFTLEDFVQVGDKQPVQEARTVEETGTSASEEALPETVPVAASVNGARPHSETE